MSTKTFARSTALAAALVTGLFAAVAQADVVPADYATGVVTAVDAARGTIVVDGKTIRVSPHTLIDLTIGSEVDVAYVFENGTMKALAVDPVDPEATGELVD